MYIVLCICLLQSLLQSLCDVELSLIDDLDSLDINTQLANELPDPDTHEKITLAFMEHIGNYDHCYASILLSLRTLLMFTDYNYTFNCLTRCVLLYAYVIITFTSLYVQ